MTHQEVMRLASATYRALESLPESDPLKSKSKTKVLEILEGITGIYGDHGWESVASYLQPGRRELIDALLQSIGVLRNYLKLARLQGFLDGATFLILDKEYHAITQSLGAMNISPAVAMLHAGQMKKESTSPAQEGALAAEKQKKYASRQEKILAFLENHQKAQVSDIVKEMPDVTKRTIRRDLDELLKMGKIARFGEFNQVFYQINS